MKMLCGALVISSGSALIVQPSSTVACRAPVPASSVTMFLGGGKKVPAKKAPVKKVIEKKAAPSAGGLSFGFGKSTASVPDTPKSNLVQKFFSTENWATTSKE